MKHIALLVMVALVLATIGTGSGARYAASPLLVTEPSMGVPDGNYMFTIASEQVQSIVYTNPQTGQTTIIYRSGKGTVKQWLQVVKDLITLIGDVYIALH